LIISNGSMSIFITRPISLGFLIAFVVIVLWQMVSSFRKSRRAYSCSDQICEDRSGQQ
jgi:TctA family transporter